MARLTIAQLKKRAPNLPDAELRRSLRITHRLEKLVENAKRRSDSPAARRKWQQYVASMLSHCKSGFDAGGESAFWDAVLFCEQTGTLKPVWLAGALEKYALDRINGRKPFPRRSGRPSHPALDAYIFALTEEWREEHICFGHSRKPRRFSYDRAFTQVADVLAKDGIHLSPEAIRAAYRRGRGLIDAGRYIGSPFEEIVA